MSEDREVPELLSTQAQAVVDRAKSLGLTWTLRPATVSAIVPSSVVYDGDTVVVGAVSLTGNTIPGDRVMMLQIPPGGNYIIGRLPGSPKTATYTTPTFRGELLSLADVTLTTSTQNVGQLLTVVLASAGQYLVTGSADLDQTASGGNNLGGATLQVNGVGRGDQILFGVTAAGQRAVLSKTWVGTLAAGSNTFRLVASKSLNIGTFICRAAGTGFAYQIWQ